MNQTTERHVCRCFLQHPPCSHPWTHEPLTLCVDCGHKLGCHDEPLIKGLMDSKSLATTNAISTACTRALADLTAIKGAYIEMAAALQMLHDEMADYARINNLGGYDNQAMVRARNALAVARFVAA